MMSINIKMDTGTANTTVAKGRSIEWIVIHYTAGTSSAIGIGRKVTVKKGTWNVRKLPSADAAVITRVKGGQVLNVATGWSYVPALGGWISDKGLE